MLDVGKTILVDTRNQKGKHPQDEALSQMYTLQQQALPIGDYCVKTKRCHDMEEIRRRETYTLVKFKDAPLDSSYHLSVFDMIGCYSVCIDTKKDIYELSANLLNTKSRFRFERELLRAVHAGVNLYVLVGDDNYCNGGLENLANYHGVHNDNPTAGIAMIERMNLYNKLYGTQFIISSKENMAKNIAEILGYETLP